MLTISFISINTSQISDPPVALFDSFFCHFLSQMFPLVLCHLGFAGPSSPASPYVPLMWVLSICRLGFAAKALYIKLQE